MSMDTSHPIQPFANGKGHDSRDVLGRFAAGNQAAKGRGNPYPAQVASWRATLVEVVT